MSPFVKIEDAFLASIATDSEAIPTLYFEGNPLTRGVFWLRLRWLHQLAVRHADATATCLDFGCGGGVFLPTLAGHFPRVVAADLETAEASRVVERYGLDNVELVRADLTRDALPHGPFGAVFAADVLEHFRDLSPPAGALRQWLANDGFLFTSLPTESLLYRLLRLAFGIVKPEDHYHSGYEVERYLASHGFQRVRRWYVPARLPVLPLFLVSAWRKA